MGTVSRRGFTLVFAQGFAAATLAAPVEVYREGPQFCPQDRPPTAQPITESAAIQRARSLVPKEFCALSRFVAGCEADTEFVEGTWRVFLQQFQLRGYRRDTRGLGHTYVILDRVGNCVANSPGTEQFGRE
jgi:hypothetical protein